mgnify:CR=1 FL=1
MDQSLTSGVKKFDGTDYEVWSTLVEAVLVAKGLDSTITEEGDAGDAKWLQKDKSARALILLALEPEMVKLVLSCSTAKQVWERLKTVHSQKSESCKMLLQKEFYDVKMEPGTKMSEYVAKIEFIARRLRDIGVTLDDDTVISKIVSGLAQDYKHFMSNWMSTPKEERTYVNLLPRLLAEETIHSAAEPTSSSAMKMEASDRKNMPGKHRGQKKKKSIECYHCHKKGHMKRDCKQLKREEGDKESDSEKRKTRDKDPQALSGEKYAVVASAGKGDETSWLIDSGASFHMTGHSGWFRTYKPQTHKIPIRVGNNEYLYAIGSGTVEVVSTVGKEKITILLKDCFYVPGISDNLFSQGAADSKGIKSVSNGGKMHLIHGNKTIMVGERGSDNLYRLKLETPARAFVARSERTLEEWHRVLGHPDINQVKNLARNCDTIGFKIVETAKDPRQCSECTSGKMCHVPHPESGRVRSTSVLHRVHVDLVGAITPPSLGGSQYFMLIRDEYSSYMHVYFMAAKSQVLHAIKKYINEASVQTQNKVQIIRSDNGSEFKNTSIKLLCESEGIIQEFSAPFTAQQNGQIERANRTIIETARSMLASSRLPLSLWGEAVLTAVYLRNRMPNRVTGSKSPFEIYHGRPAVYSHLIEFGKEVQVLDNSKAASKFSTKTIEGFMVGYADRINTYRIFNHQKNSIMITSDIVEAPHTKSFTRVEHHGVGLTFTIGNELDTTRLSDGSDDELEEDRSIYPDIPVRSSSLQPDRVPPSIDLEPTSEEAARKRCTLNETFEITKDDEIRRDQRRLPEIEPTLTILDQRDQIRPRVTMPAARTDRAGASSVAPTPSASVKPAAPTLPQGNPVSQRQQIRESVVAPVIQKSGVGPMTHVPVSPDLTAGAVSQPSTLVQRLKPSFDWVMKDRERRQVVSKYARNLSAVACPYEPSSYAEALSCEDSSKWASAIAEELTAHSKNGTWMLVPKSGQIEEIDSKWIFKVKQNADGSVNRYKARLVARGFTQQADIDYTEVFAPVVRMDSIRLLFSIAAQFKLEYKQFDVATAFLYGTVDKELYLKPPQGLDVPENYTCRLIKSLYGLKQAPRCWSKRVSDVLRQYNMKPTYSDPCVFVSSEYAMLYLALYVDDGLIFGKDMNTINKLLKQLTQEFMIKTVESSCFIGVEICRLTDGSFYLHQRGYINRILHKFGMEDSKGVTTPLEVGHGLNNESIIQKEPIIDVPYSEAIGSLLYCAIATRPDISHALSLLSKYNGKPRLVHWKGVKRILRYLRATVDYGLIYRPVTNPAISCYSDADHASDHENRRSISGVLTFLCTGPIGYKAKQQPCVAISTTEAEYVAAAIAAKELVWLNRFIKELGVPIQSQSKLLMDNQSAIKLIKNPEYHERTKHIAIRYHFTRELYESGEFEICYVPSEEELADVFTKALTANKFKHLREAIGCVKMPDMINERGC